MHASGGYDAALLDETKKNLENNIFALVCRIYETDF